MTHARVALTSPLTAASWNGAAKGAGTITIHVNTEFGVPSGEGEGAGEVCGDGGAGDWADGGGVAAVGG